MLLAREQKGSPQSCIMVTGRQHLQDHVNCMRLWIWSETSSILHCLKNGSCKCRWLRKDKEMKLQEQKNKSSDKSSAKKLSGMAEWSNGWAAGRMTASIKDSSNAVMRM